MSPSDWKDMKRSQVTMLMFVLVAGCSASRQSSSTSAVGAQAPRPPAQVLTRAAFVRIRDYVLRHGDRQTYCTMYNDNPHVALRHGEDPL